MYQDVYNKAESYVVNTEYSPNVCCFFYRGKFGKFLKEKEASADIGLVTRGSTLHSTTSSIVVSDSVSERERILSRRLATFMQQHTRDLK